ncbi:MAG: hypothetical protein COZ49_01315 [Candidatus Yonathbacteria bacterium CG_4_10_14_3_um_filter_47_65]|uniref:Uncharacterized protein n=2 Tax=Parcubacteria group TaxID=1794811 RepID=A0A2M8D9J9_9BACT|nr:MAG: hypothetical protein AUJ44_02820 [Candidatus Nomurabacteria bacterium CG1_02_47_685]PIP03989.1 MAG: hypothetical protein COX54_01705 [Candidatus Yonathbacteria bacterium CG23_combo_of_CG06-09_8_20_14_all_46_18]PIQ33205.1 MAG: hypothetical protein COW61_00080 [Candidatus Yonathbacteria bacterium CG17_big_fil_post_rev_8_21_14_2_50_46_19]PIX56603.1 MAG: hypothetical protein COZ49_01315 [Candidatus Yonathbacteria bacterium CG_4_10_14_3_um_filter_47_65]PIY57399.1 MAG: hypothetical protein CO
MEESIKNNNIFTRFKASYGVAGVFLFAIIVIASYIKIDNFLGLLNMYSILTPDEFQALLFSVFSFETIASLALSILGIITIYFFIKLKDNALVYAFAFLILQPVLDGVTEIGYSGNIGSGIGPLIGGGIAFWIFWHFLGNKTSNYLKLNYGK